MKRMSVTAAAALAVLPSLVALGLGAQTVAADWPQYLGPQRDGVYRGPALADSWGPGWPEGRVDEAGRTRIQRAGRG